MNSWLASIGSPCSRLPSATPISSGASRLPAVSSESQVRRQRGESRLPRNSKETPRTISATSRSTSGEVERGEHRRVPPRERGEHPGAGDDEPHLVAVPQRPDRVDRDPTAGLVVPTTPCSMPTPKSKPSSTKNPVHSTAMTMNQNVVESSRPSVLIAGRRARPAVGTFGRRAPGGRTAASGSRRRPESAVEQEEDHEAGPTSAVAHRRRDAVLGAAAGPARSRAGDRSR